MRQTPVEETFDKGPRRVFLVSILIFVLAASLIIGGIINFQRGKENQTALEEQTKQIKTLVEQVKTVSEENKRLNQTSVNYSYCNAYLLARYTQTQKPIQIDDLNNCVLTVFPTGEGAPNVPAESLQGTQSKNSTSTNTTTPTSPSTTQPSTVAPTTPTIPTTPATPQSQPLVQLQPSTILPILNVIPDINIPGILQVR